MEPPYVDISLFPDFIHTSFPVTPPNIDPRIFSQMARKRPLCSMFSADHSGEDAELTCLGSRTKATGRVRATLAFSAWGLP